MLKYIIPMACFILAGCATRTHQQPYYDVPPAQPTAYYSYSHPIQTPAMQTSLRHPVIKTTPAPKPLTPANND